MEFEKLSKIIAEVLNVDVDEITMDTTFVDELGADSLDVFQIIMGIEEEFDIEITRVLENAADGRQLVLSVTDPELIEATGGIVQGMSGSPILQNGKLVGAVTHVLLNDATKGYGIFIETMLNAS